MQRLYLPRGLVADDAQLLTATVVGTLAGQKRQIAETAAKAIFGLPRKVVGAAIVEPEFAQKSPAQRLEICKRAADNSLMAYKGRPLNGIWATAPYLHNGSVRSLHELLLAPDKRTKSFPVGIRSFDATEVGFFAKAPGAATFEVRDKQGQDIPGNSNLGHDYGNASFKPDERTALIEYMKSL
jgi:hypothetical protein